MRTVLRSISVLGLVAFGYVLGASDFLSPEPVGAQVADAGGPSEEITNRIIATGDQLKSILDSLAQDGRYRSATKGINAFAATVGGVDAIDDLETGRGVDPETFAALYAGQAIDDIAQHLDKDDQQRLMYKNRVIRMYPVSRLKSLYVQRLRFTNPDDFAN